MRPAEASPEPKGRRSREVLAFIRNEVAEGREFPTTGAIKVAMSWKAAATVDDVLLRLLAAGFIEREVGEAGRFKALGVKAGVPDLLALHGGRLFALELKAERGRVSDAQAAMLADLEAAGAKVAVAHGLNDALAQLEAWGLIRASAISRTTPGAGLQAVKIAEAG